MKLILFATLFFSASALKRIGGWRQAEVSPERPSIVNCTWKFFQQKIDHFGDSDATFPQRYCIYSDWWKSAEQGGFTTKNEPSQTAVLPPGPILFYTGNESPVEEYINNTGLMWELGESMGALLVFAEHRYEPLSHPAVCGDGTQNCFAYCTTAQALAGKSQQRYPKKTIELCLDKLAISEHLPSTCNDFTNACIRGCGVGQ
jgi:hypothetical protein